MAVSPNFGAAIYQRLHPWSAVQSGQSVKVCREGLQLRSSTMIGPDTSNANICPISLIEKSGHWGLGKSDSFAV
jgi:hypothetical protein